ncbi:hypothetical protein LZ012_12210 [Dechloromonas sp. XY25]|uniref:Tetratricopeptide repeat protein n=1 Tax=Dechloromonas hankyongensis TaxID=2908002 RepID=A0ABS9K3M1_9RHOO|nr:hypothetical protein [Dechloromonas hankyongensis]MCG2577758.1 hypothetical protein [Dechloromonas hankyongensis]
MKKAIFACIFSAGTLIVQTAYAFPATDTEMALVPNYCRDTQGFGYGDATSNPSPRSGHWVSLMGKTFWAMHHYCRGLIKRNRAMKSGISHEERQHLLKSAIDEYEYVLNNNKDAEFILLPEIYTRIGEASILISNPSAAEQAFAHARQIKADYWPAYSHWAEYLIQKGKRTEAKQLVKSGLEQTPNAKVLIDQYRLLGGKPSEIIPVVKKPAIEDNADEMTTAPKRDSSPENPTSKSDAASKQDQQSSLEKQ